MTESKRSIRSDLAKVDRHKLTAKEYKEAPVWSADELADATLEHGGRPVKRGRPPSDDKKIPITIRLDRDTVARYRDSGPGWQTKMNDVLRQGAPRAKRKTG